MLAATGTASAQQWQQLYQPLSAGQLPGRLRNHNNFDASQKYPVILSLHGAGGKGSDNRKQLKVWNGQLAEKAVRTKFPCYVLAPQAAGLWNGQHLKQIKEIIKGLPAIDMDRIYVLGH